MAISQIYVTNFVCCVLERDPMDYIMYWLNSIRSRADTRVPVFLVGTHADELKGYAPLGSLIEHIILIRTRKS